MHAASRSLGIDYYIDQIKEDESVAIVVGFGVGGQIRGQFLSGNMFHPDPLTLGGNGRKINSGQSPVVEGSVRR